MTFDSKSLPLLTEAVERLQEGFKDLPATDDQPENEEVRQVLLELAEKLQDNFPYQHPLYAGQMLKPPHAVARLAYALTMFVNPNNHALDGGRATSALEKEAVANLAEMFGYDQHVGHLTGGGTMANLEALWVAGQLHPGKTILASEQAHYTHSRISSVLNIPFQNVPCDSLGCMDMSELRKILSHGEVGTVVVTAGTTSIGSVDPLKAVLSLKEEFGFRVHVDAAYGGYFILADNLEPDVRETFDLLHQADSIVIDPHKHGLQPYGCGCVLFANPGVGALYKHDSPYTYFSSDELHLGEISLECSRPGSSAAALWATQQLLPLTKDGEFAKNISRSRDAAIRLHSVLRKTNKFLLPLKPDLDIVVYAPKAASAKAITDLSKRMFRIAAQHNLHLAMATLSREFLEQTLEIKWDADSVTVLRSCLLKPEHLDWVDRIAELLVLSYDQATKEAVGSLT